MNNVIPCFESCKTNKLRHWSDQSRKCILCGYRVHWNKQIFSQTAKKYAKKSGATKTLFAHKALLEPKHLIGNTIEERAIAPSRQWKWSDDHKRKKWTCRFFTPFWPQNQHTHVHCWTLAGTIGFLREQHTIYLDQVRHEIALKGKKALMVSCSLLHRALKQSNKSELDHQEDGTEFRLDEESIGHPEGMPNPEALVQPSRDDQRMISESSWKVRRFQVPGFPCQFHQRKSWHSLRMSSSDISASAGLPYRTTYCDLLPSARFLVLDLGMWLSQSHLLLTFSNVHGWLFVGQ